MGYLTRNDVAAALDCVRELYENTASEDFPHRALSILSSIVSADGVLFGSINGQKGSALHITYPVWEFDKRGLLGFGEYMHQHPALGYLLSPSLRLAAERRSKSPEIREAFSRPLMAGCGARLSDAFDKRRYHRLEVFNEALKPLGMEHQLGTNFNVNNGMADCVSFCRTGMDFTERERNLFDLLIPHFIQSMNNHKAFSGNRKNLETLEQLTEGEGVGLFSVADNGKIKFRNEKAEHLLTHKLYFGLGGADRLPELAMKWFHGTAKAFKGDALPTTGAVPFCAEMEGSRVVFRFGGILKGNEMMVCVEEQSHPANCVEGHGLTPREGEVLHWVAQGKSNEEIALILNIAPRTVKKHLERVFQKLGVENRTAAALMAMEMNTAGK